MFVNAPSLAWTLQLRCADMMRTQISWPSFEVSYFVPLIVLGFTQQIRVFRGSKLVLFLSFSINKLVFSMDKLTSWREVNKTFGWRHWGGSCRRGKLEAVTAVKDNQCNAWCSSGLHSHVKSLYSHVWKVRNAQIWLSWHDNMILIQNNRARPGRHSARNMHERRAVVPFASFNSCCPSCLNCSAKWRNP